MITIDKDVPIPEITRGAGMKYPWKSMDVGDSFLIGNLNSSAHTQASMAGKKYGRKFLVRREGQCYRVWRAE